MLWRRRRRTIVVLWRPRCETDSMRRVVAPADSSKIAPIIRVPPAVACIKKEKRDFRGTPPRPRQEGDSPPGPPSLLALISWDETYIYWPCVLGFGTDQAVLVCL